VIDIEAAAELNDMDVIDSGPDVVTANVRRQQTVS